MLKDILIWLFVFIVGSLIVSFLIYPNTFQSFKSNIEEIEDSITTTHSVTPTPTKDFYGFPTSTPTNNPNENLDLRIVKDSCYDIENLYGKTNAKKLKKIICVQQCNGLVYGVEKLYYNSYKCGGTKNRDLFCYCEK